VYELFAHSQLLSQYQPFVPPLQSEFDVHELPSYAPLELAPELAASYAEHGHQHPAENIPSATNASAKSAKFFDISITTTAF